MSRDARTAAGRPPTLAELFRAVRANYFRLYLHYCYFNIGRIFYLQLDNVFSLFVLLPTIVAGKLTLGPMNQIINVFSQVSSSFQYLVNSWSTIVELQSIYKRLRAFEAAITRRLGAGRPFALLVADMDALKDFNRDEGFTAGNDALRRLADSLANSLGPEDDVARVGSDEFAILASIHNADGAARLATKLERMLLDDRTKATLGWAAFPQEGDNALALYRAASERLYARKVMRSYLRPVPDPVEAAG